MEVQVEMEIECKGRDKGRDKDKDGVSSQASSGAVRVSRICDIFSSKHGWLAWAAVRKTSADFRSHRTILGWRGSRAHRAQEKVPAEAGREGEGEGQAEADGGSSLRCRKVRHR